MRLDHVVDADSSQTVVVETVRRGLSLVVEGPPGTGKSQSITNLVATAVLDGKKVLFVAEKLAALEVVKRRLDEAGLGALCLELHSHKAKKRAVLEEIGRTWQLGRPRDQELEAIVDRLEDLRGRINGHVERLHTPLAATGITPYRLIGELAALKDRQGYLGDVTFDGAEAWDAGDIKERVEFVSDLAGRLARMGKPSDNPWRGAEIDSVLSDDLPNIGKKLDELAAALEPLRANARALAAHLRQPEPDTFADIDALWRMAGHAARAPELDPAALRCDTWRTGIPSLSAVVMNGRELLSLREKLAPVVVDRAFEKDLREARRLIAKDGQSFRRFVPFFNEDFNRGMDALRSVVRREPPSEHAERLELLDNLI